METNEKKREEVSEKVFGFRKQEIVFEFIPPGGNGGISHWNACPRYTKGSNLMMYQKVKKRISQGHGT